MSYVRSGKNRHDTPWTDDMIAEVMRRWIAGDHADDIADAIGVSRNAFNGKLRRLNLPPRARVVKRAADVSADRRYRWSEGMKQKLVEMFNAGFTCAEMGAKLRMSKDAVIGQMHRLGLSRPSPIIRDPNHVSKYKRRPRVVGPTIPPVPALDASIPSPAPHLAPSASAPGSGQLVPAAGGTGIAPATRVGPSAPPPGSAHLLRRNCQFPLWGFRERPTGVFCEAPATHGSYCVTHHRVCVERVVDMRGRTILAVAAK